MQQFYIKRHLLLLRKYMYDIQFVKFCGNMFDNLIQNGVIRSGNT